MDSVITFLDIIATSTADRMPDCPEMHLPLFRSYDAHEIYKYEFNNIYANHSPSSYNYFMRIWKAHRPYIKVRKATRFTKCSLCERLRDELADSLKRGLDTTSVMEQKRAHNSFVQRERQEYTRKKELAILRPADFLSVVIDGADQKAYSLPHFITSVKDQRGHGLKIHLIGVLQHLSPNQLRLFTMSDEHETGSNHVVEVLHRLINELASMGKMPKTLFIQLDNCVRENKNHFFLAYVDSLIHWKILDHVEVSFLPVGHTHSDVDQAFSSTSDMLRHNDAITISDIHDLLSKCYNSHTRVTSLSSVINWSGLCELQGCIQKIDAITQLRYFRFTGTQDSSGSHSSLCHVRGSVDEEWRAPKFKHEKTAKSIIGTAPDLKLCPPEILKAPSDFENVTKRIQSEEVRIKSSTKINSLYHLRDEIYVDRNIRLHWDLLKVVESVGVTPLADTAYESDHGNVSGRSDNSYDYECGSFVAVLAPSDELSLDFWIGKISSVRYNLSGTVSNVRVVWYEFYGCSDIYRAKYKPCMITSTQSKKLLIWEDEITPDTVIANFSGLTKEKRLPLNIMTHMKEQIELFRAKKSF